jgi:hypothetical protein
MMPRSAVQDRPASMTWLKPMRAAIEDRPRDQRKVRKLLAKRVGARPPVGGAFHFEISVMPSLTKICPKMVLPIKGITFVSKAFLQKIVWPGGVRPDDPIT